MAMFNPKTTPVINTLAMQFAVFDKWYSAVPGAFSVPFPSALCVRLLTHAVCAVLACRTHGGEPHVRQRW
jgi:hypothetical protein